MLFSEFFQRISSVHCSVVSDSLRPHDARQASLSITNSQSSPRPKSIESVIPSSHLILGRPLLLLPLIPPSIRVFSNESTLRMRWPKYCSFSISIIPSKEIPRLIAFKMDWLDFLAVQGTLKSLIQHHSSKASILQRSAFFTVQLSHPYMTTGKTIASTRRTFLGNTVHGILQARILEWGAFPFSRGLSQPRDPTQVSSIAGRRFNLCAAREAPEVCKQLFKYESAKESVI